MNSEALFEKLLNDEGIPTTEAGIKNDFQSLANSQSLTINNNDEISPFWRITTALMIRPAYVLTRFMITTLLPNQFLKTADNTALDLKADELGLTRLPATTAQGMITFIRTNTSGTVNIPAQTTIDSKPVNGTVYSLTTKADALLAEGESQTAVLCEATATGSGHNLGANYYTVPQQPINGISSVTNAGNWLVNPGQDEESNENLQTRYRNQFTANGQWFIDSTYKKIVSDLTGLSPNNIFLEKEAPRGPGTANLYILLDTGQPSPSLLSSIQDHIDDNRHGIGDDVSVLALPTLPIDLTFNVTLQRDTDKAALTQNISHFIRSAFRENTDYTPTRTEPFTQFSISRLMSELHQTFNAITHIECDTDRITQGANVARLNSLQVNHV